VGTSFWRIIIVRTKVIKLVNGGWGVESLKVHKVIKFIKFIKLESGIGDG